MVFWSLQGLTMLVATLYILSSYELYNTYPYRQMEVFINCLSTLVSLLDNVLIVNAFSRLQRCLADESLGISKKQIYLYYGTFFTATAALIFLYSAVLVGLYGFGGDQQQNYQHLEYVILATELCIILLTVSLMPSFYIFNSLLNQMI